MIDKITVYSILYVVIAFIAIVIMGTAGWVLVIIGSVVLAVGILKKNWWLVQMFESMTKDYVEGKDDGKEVVKWKKKRKV